VTVNTDDIGTATGEHVVHFYECDHQLTQLVGRYLAAALSAGDVAIAIATESHRDAIETFLESEGIDLAAARAQDRLLLLDAAATLATFAPDGEIRAHTFRALIGGLVRKAVESERLVKAYGEMVALLWQDGDVLGAIELERHWNELALELPFSLLCAYPSALVRGPEHADALDAVCREHCAVGELAASFPFDAHSPAHARRLLVETLQRRGWQRAQVDAAALVLSELASNAVRHVGSPFSVTATVRGSTLRLAVEDGAPVIEDRLPVRTAHGLGIVDMLAGRWGVERTHAGKIVWAELAF
jgi:MEDS: MEthanogen/methylotroph, DcmR Sensory domain/Histidine kinase-like ATPase domain